MSFTYDIKNEISLLDITKSEKIAELSGFVRANGNFQNNSILLYTENIKIGKRIFSFLKDIYGINLDIEKKENNIFNKKKIYYINIDTKADTILQDLSVFDSKGKFLEMPEDYIVGSLDEIKSYIRGSFLARGSINDPKTARYHLEFLFDNKQEAVFVQRMLNEFDLNSKILLRDKKCMVYVKDSNKISDFLKIIGAFNAVMYYENIIIFKEKKNITNRLNNCEQANMDKVLISCNEQIKDIDLILEKLGKEFLDDKLKEAVDYRLKYPESSLLELSQIISLETNKNITKSGLNHRFRKLKTIAQQLKNK